MNMAERTAVQGAAMLLAFRKSRGLTQQKVADALGCSGPTVNDWENAKKRPDAKFRARIATWTGGEIPESDWLLPDEVVDVAPAAAAGQGA